MADPRLGRALGRRPPSNKPALMLGDFLTGVVPAHPAAADHFAKVPQWILGGNDRYGVCGPVSVANQRLLVTTYLTGTPEIATQAAIFDLYRRSGNPTFDPNDPGGPGDAGVDMQTMLEAVVAGGIGGKHALAFAKVDVSNIDQIEAAVALFGGNLLGVTLDVAQQAQTDAGTWDYAPSGVWGGHATLNGRYADAPDRGGVVTWAEIVDFTDAFEAHQVDEAWVVIWPEHLGSRAFQAGVDLAALAAAYTALTGRPFPVIPGPSPTPAPADVDATFAAVLRPWVALRHSGVNAVAAKAAKVWLATQPTATTRPGEDDPSVIDRPPTMEE